MYKDEYHPGLKKDLKQLDKPVISEIKDFQISKILENRSQVIPSPVNSKEFIHTTSKRTMSI